MTPTSGPQLRTLITEDGKLQLSLLDKPIPELKDDEVLIRIQASPINPSDLGLLLGPADPATATSGPGPTLTADIPPALMRAVAPRVGQSLPAGNEGAGEVIAAGSAAQGLLGKTVAGFGGAFYAQYRVLKAAECLVLPPGATAHDGASCFVNPLTALGMVGTMRLEGHKGLVHTAAASNLGQMLVKICKADGVPLVNVVRSPAQVALLKGIGAEHVVDTSDPNFMTQLIDALVATGATLAFDAIGGGKLAGQILTAMEAAVNKTSPSFNRYGSSVHKQLYIYGGLDTGPTEFNRGFGMSWGMGGWLLMPYLDRVGPTEAQKMRERVAAELKTTFASGYSNVISLAGALDPANVAVYARRATGEKFLIDPSL